MCPGPYSSHHLRSVAVILIPNKQQRLVIIFTHERLGFGLKIYYIMSVHIIFILQSVSLGGRCYV